MVITVKKIFEIDYEKVNADCVNLTNLCYGKEVFSIENKAFLKKHLDNPFGKSYSGLIYDDEKLIALNLFLAWEFVINGKVIKAAQSVDSLVHPDYRGRLFT